MLKDPSSLVDIHSHLVPAVDDGAKDLVAVLNSIDRFTQVGIRRVVTTPHIQASLTLDPVQYEKRLSTVTEAFEKAAVAIRADFPAVEYRRGHEVLIDIPEPDLSDVRIRMAGTSFVLLEWPRLHIPPGTTRVLRWIRDQGYRPIVAHPERYAGMVKQRDMAARWRESGAYLQLNYGSLLGRYGAEAQIVAYRLMEAGLVDYMASDFHGHSSLKVYKKEAWAAIEERDGAGSLECLCKTNPSRLLEDLEPVPAPAIGPAPGLLNRLRDMVRRPQA